VRSGPGELTGNPNRVSLYMIMNSKNIAQALRSEFVIEAIEHVALFPSELYILKSGRLKPCRQKAHFGDSASPMSWDGPHTTNPGWDWLSPLLHSASASDLQTVRIGTFLRERTRVRSGPQCLYHTVRTSRQITKKKEKENPRTGVLYR